MVSSLNATIAFLDGADWVERYAYFGDFRAGDGNSYVGQSGAVWDEDGGITEVGMIWLGLNRTPGISSMGGIGRPSCLAFIACILTGLVFIG